MGRVHAAHVHYTYHTCTPRPQAVTGHLIPPGYGFGVKNQKKVDDAVVFGLRGMHNHTHLGYVMIIQRIGDVFRLFGAFFGVRGPPEGGPRLIDASLILIAAPQP